MDRVQPNSAPASGAGAATSRPPSLVASVRALVAVLGSTLRRRLLICAALMLLGAVAELATIGALIPLLALLVDPDQAARLPGLGLLFELSGSRSPQALITGAVLLLCIAAAASAAIRLLILRYTQAVTLSIGHEIGCLVFWRVLNQPLIAHLRRNPSELLASVQKVQLLVGALLMPLMLAAIAAVIGGAIMIFLFVLEPLAAGAAALVGIAAYGAATRLAQRGLRENSEVLSRTSGERMRLLQEAIGGIRVILLNHSQADFEERYRAVDREFYAALANNQFIGQAPRYIVEALGIVLMGLFTLYLSSRPGGLVGAIPLLGVAALGAQRLLPLLQQSYSGWSQAVGNLQAVDDVLALVAEPVSAGQRPDTEVRPFQRSVELDQLSFNYSERRPALHRISFTLPKGARLGFVGRSGSGKSTLIDLITGLLQPASGRVLIDGEPLTDSNRFNWQAQIAVVPQDIYLADRSISANIAFGEPPERIDEERVRAAAAAARIDEFIRELPDGYATAAGERGVSLSGGQRQRIGIARALYRRANLLIFDEATSALDSETESELLATLTGLGPEITLILVSHRDSFLEQCDMIVRLERGRIKAVEQRGPAAGRDASPQAAVQ